MGFLYEVKKKVLFSLSAYWRAYAMIKFQNVASRGEAEKYLEKNQKNCTFVLGTGRSGTQLITSLLSQCSDMYACHEPNYFMDVGQMVALRENEGLTERYWKEFRQYELFNRWKKSGKKYYAEVNGTIKYHGKVLASLYPKANFFILARDPKGTVRSIMGWSFYLSNSKGAYAISPLPHEPIYGAWEKMSRFEKVCWNVADVYEKLLAIVPENRVLKLEELTSDYEKTKQVFFDQIGITVDKDKWNEVVKKPSKNKTQQYKYPEYEEWSHEEKKIYKKIFGKIEKRLGYDEVSFFER